jgi:hypothetical protein
MATLPKVLINRADYQIGGGVALRLRTQGTLPYNQGRGQGERRPAAASREALFGLGELQKYGRLTLLSGLAGRGNLEISLGAGSLAL